MTDTVQTRTNLAELAAKCQSYCAPGADRRPSRHAALCRMCRMSQRQGVCRWKASAREVTSPQADRWGTGSQGSLPGGRGPTALSFEGYSKQRNALEKGPAWCVWGGPVPAQWIRGALTSRGPRVQIPLLPLGAMTTGKPLTSWPHLLISKTWAVKTLVRPGPGHRRGPG